MREGIAEECLDDMIEWLAHGGGQLGIYDGNNVTEERRREIHEKLVARDIHVIQISIPLTPELYSLFQFFNLDSPFLLVSAKEGMQRPRTHVIPESICNKPEIVYANIRSVKISSPDVRNRTGSG